MKLRFKLILASLLLSVVPLSGVIVYPYINSQRAVRQAVEAEAQMMADGEQSQRSATIKATQRPAMTLRFSLQKFRNRWENMPPNSRVFMPQAERHNL